MGGSLFAALKLDCGEGGGELVIDFRPAVRPNSCKSFLDRVWAAVTVAVAELTYGFLFGCVFDGVDL